MRARWSWQSLERKRQRKRLKEGDKVCEWVCERKRDKKGERDWKKHTLSTTREPLSTNAGTLKLAKLRHSAYGSFNPGIWSYLISVAMILCFTSSVRLKISVGQIDALVQSVFCLSIGTKRLPRLSYQIPDIRIRQL